MGTFRADGIAAGWAEPGVLLPGEFASRQFRPLMNITTVNGKDERDTQGDALEPGNHLYL
ncbi:hypothetical protein JT06_11435 [Desulfobulbus sp. Tol-SR]|jgi:hypothetical protein|nr:hypothetical protein JT06_11435 [Desulfobulbus sp. Tol-SR]